MKVKVKVKVSARANVSHELDLLLRHRAAAGREGARRTGLPAYRLPGRRDARVTGRKRVGKEGGLQPASTSDATLALEDFEALAWLTLKRHKCRAPGRAGIRAFAGTAGRPRCDARANGHFTGEVFLVR